MYVNITGSKNNKDVYIYQSYRKANGKPSSRIYRKLGKYNELLEQFSGDSDKLMAWAKEEAAKDTAEYNAKKEKVSIDFSQTYRIPLDEERSFHAGYLFLQQLCSELRLDNICRNIRNHRKITYDLHAVLTDLIYARILSPSSKLSSYAYCQTLLEPPKYSLHNVYRALSDLLYQPAGLPPSGEKTGRRIYLQPDLRNTPRDEHDAFKQKQRLYSFV